MSKPLTPTQARAVWRILVDMGGANPADEESFKHYVTQDIGAFPHEFRFQGHFGYGGKFHNGSAYRSFSRTVPNWTVSCYNEDVTPERMELAVKMEHAMAQVWIMEDVREFLLEIEKAHGMGVVSNPTWAESAHDLLWYLDNHVIAPLRA